MTPHSRCERNFLLISYLSNKAQIDATEDFCTKYGWCELTSNPIIASVLTSGLSTPAVILSVTLLMIHHKKTANGIKR